MGSVYLNSHSSPAPRRGAPRRALSVVFGTLSLLLVALAAFGGYSQPLQASAEDDGGFVQRFACWFDEDTVPRKIYQLTQTSDLQFSLLSKSTLGTGTDSIDGGLNAVLNFVNRGQGEQYTYLRRNSIILGNARIQANQPGNPAQWNKGREELNPFDRFGVAGLRFSSYGGEWRHFFIDACNSSRGASGNVATEAVLPPSSGDLVIASTNIKNSENNATIRAAVDKVRATMPVDPNVWLFQEAFGASAADFEAQLGPTWKAYKPVGVRDKESVVVAWDTTRFNAKDQGSKQIYNPPADGPYEVYQGQQKRDWTRWATWVTLSNAENTFSVVSTHGKLGAAGKSRQWNHLTYLQDDLLSSGPVLVGGDFNDNALIKEKQRAAGFKTGASANVDHIFYSSSATTTGGAVIPKATLMPHMDHPAVWNSFSLVGSIGGGESPAPVVNADMLDPGTGDFYEGRLEPRSTWEDIAKSKDVRSMQFSKGFGARYYIAVMTNASNFIFSITKMIVVFTIALIGLAFSDIMKVLGIDVILIGDGGGSSGIYGSLYQSVFGPLVVMAFVLTGCYLIYYGIVKRQYRNAMGMLVRTLACFFAAVIVSASPAWFIALPNNVAVVTQALAASALNQGLAGGNGMCESDLGYLAPNGRPGADVERAENFLKRASLNMQSSVGCAYWNTFLFRPWVEGQFGESNHTALNGPRLGNRNGPYGYTGDERQSKGWVGRPTVPLGHGKTVDNWALFHLSTQTNVHSPIGANGELSDYSQGVANDWWRVVDAFSNYQEDSEIRSRVRGEGGAYSGSRVITYAGPLEPEVLEQWDFWAGNSQMYRLMTALTSVVVAGLGVLAPLAFAALSAMYAIGLAILMAFAPIMFLLGCWAGRGFELFKAWGDLVITTTVKRIVTGVLMMVSIIVTSVALSLMNSVGYWQGLLVMIILSVALFKSRTKIVQALNFLRFSSVDLSQTASRVTQTIGTAAGTAGRFGAAAAGGAVQSKRYGGTVTGGMLAGMKQETQNLALRSPVLKSIEQTVVGQKMNNEDVDVWAHRYCAVCSQPLINLAVWESDELGYVCGRCESEGMVEDANFVGYAITTDEVAGRSVYESSKPLQTARTVVADDLNTTLSEDERAEAVAAKLAAVRELATASAAEISKYRSDRAKAELIKGAVGRVRNTEKDELAPPAVPAEIAPYLDMEAVEEAWKNDETDFLKLAYTVGWIEHARAVNPAVAQALDGAAASDILAEVQLSEGADWYRHTRG